MASNHIIAIILSLMIH